MSEIGTEKSLDGSFLDVRTDGVIFSPQRFDLTIEARRLQAAANRHTDPKNRQWFAKNRESLSNGKLYRWRGGEIDVSRTQDFVDKLAEGFGVASRAGRYNIHWSSQNLVFGEKGVDADLIVQAMEDLLQHEVDVFVFFTNDSDFIPLFQRIKNRDKSIYICGIALNLSQHLLKAVGGEGSFFDLASSKLAPSFPEVWLKSKEPADLKLLDQCMDVWRYHQQDTRTR